MTNAEDKRNEGNLIDFFEVLGEERRPWLDLDALKEKYQKLALASHPDIRPQGQESDEFKLLTEAYRVLSDPKLRLHHLLQLEGSDPGKTNAIPESLLDLFSRMSDFIARATRFWTRWQEATNALSKSVLRGESRLVRHELDQLLADTTELFRQADRTTRALNPSWRLHLAEIGQAYQVFGFVTRWLAQLYEWKFRLDNG